MISPIQPTPVEFAIFNKRIAFYNDVLGVLCVALGFSALGTEAPRFYGVLSMIFVVLIMFHHGQQYERIMQLWRQMKHPFTHGTYALRQGKIFLSGWVFLVLVSLGAFTKHGLIGFY